MSNQEKDEEEILLNPGMIEEIQKRKELKQEEKRGKLLDENLIAEKEKKMFDENERTNHKDIIPAKDRIVPYSRRSLGKLFQNKIDNRPLSAVTSTAGFGDATT